MKSVYNILFGSANELRLTPPKQSALDLFKTDINSIPDLSFRKSELKLNTKGETIQKFTKRLTIKECDIFDWVEVKMVDKVKTSITFRSCQPDNIRQRHIRNLIDELYAIYGDDSFGNGSYTDKDKMHYKNRQYIDIFGRHWLDYFKYTYPVMISRTLKEMQLTIWFPCPLNTAKES